MILEGRHPEYSTKLEELVECIEGWVVLIGTI